MKSQKTKKISDFISILIFTITVLLFNGSCSKGTNSPDPGKPITGSSTIVYTDVKPDSVILKNRTDSFNLDLNNDGIIDFVFNRSTNGGICGGNDLFGYSYRYYTNLSVIPANGNNEIISDGSYALALDASSAIVSDSLWATVSQMLINGTVSTSGRCTGLPPSAGDHWINVSDKYLGLKFIKDNNTYYGWARLSSSYSLNSVPYRHLIIGQLILKDYAYNIIPNQPILAGQTK